LLESLLPHGLSGLVNNAGFVQPGPLECIPPDSFSDLLAVNVEGVHRVTAAFLPLLRKGNGKKPGRVVNISSMSGVFALPILGAYNASKFALEGMSDAWRRELRPQGVGVFLVQPGPIRTPIWRRADSLSQHVQANMSDEQVRLYTPVMTSIQKHSQAAEKTALPPERVVRAIKKALCARRPPLRQVVGWRTWGVMQLGRWLPGKWIDFIIMNRT
ncbi:MAG: SDR family NAD(P)-dependent oxidoreductase, partial [Planctomycetes bacterium]|nr:SDR family NAD(P)-dependent oxidoreductase [Planctomycetota bacterium]